MYLWLGGDSWERLAGDGDNRALVSLDWAPGLQSDENLNDSDKSFTVPADTEWIVKWIWVEFIAGAGANRQLEIQIQDDGADVIGQVRAGVVIAAAATQYHLFAPNVTDLAALRDTDYVSTTMPEWILPESYVVRVWDNAAVLPAADDMVVQMMVLARTVT